jgi:hypothetical protein
MRKLILPCLLVFGLLFSGCYQAQVTTGNEPGGETITETRSGYLWGLSMQGFPIDGASKCPNGVASVSTKLTFVDLLIRSIGPVGLFYAPMHVTIECAGGGMSSVMPAPDVDYTLPGDATKAETKSTITAAAKQSAATQSPVQVKVND